MNTFTQAVQNEENKPKKTRTTNGAVAFDKTSKPVLDFFSSVGAMRGQPTGKLFNSALDSNEELAVRALLWARDVREGAGERKAFRDNLKTMCFSNYQLAEKIIVRVPELGRWDDVLVAFNTPIEAKAISMIVTALKAGDGLCAKWMPRQSSKTDVVATKLRKAMDLTPKQYRKMLVNLTNVVEQAMCSKEWDSIDFSKVPSVAAFRYKNAFTKNSEDAYNKYLVSLTKGEAGVKVNAGAVYPHQVISMVGFNCFDSNTIMLANAQWDALPNFIPSDSSVLPMIDVSGSMDCSAGGGKDKCIDIALGLGIYLAEKNSGAFKDLYLTFSSESKLKKLEGNNIVEKLKYIDYNDWNMSTNLESAFECILKLAIKNKVQVSDMPKTIVIFSDMQFDMCTSDPSSTTMKMIKNQYKEAGYQVPKIVFWNLKYSGNQPVKSDTRGAALVSGFSPSLMKHVLCGDELEVYDPANVMLEVLMKDRYNY